MAHRGYRRTVRLWVTRTGPKDIDEEFQFHLAHRARELESQGHSPQQARELALAQFGDIDEARAFCRAEDEARMRTYRRTLWMETIRQDVRLALRALRRQPTLALSTVLTLGVAIALATAAYGVVHAYLVRPLPYPEPERLVRIRQSPTRDPFPNAPSMGRVDWSVADSVFTETVVWNPDAFTVASTDRTESLRGAWVSRRYFTALGLRPGTGRLFTEEEHLAGAPVVILSDAVWRRLFARDPAIVGRTVRMHSSESEAGAELATVVGIMPPDAWHVDRFTDVLRPMQPQPYFPMIARLAPGMTIDEAQRRLNALVLPQLGAVDPAFHLSLVNIRDEYTYRIRPTLIALMGGAWFLLLIAGASVAGAQTARASARSGEIQVRFALGASRARITAQLLVESLVVAGAAGIIGAVIAWAVLTTFGGAVGEQLGATIPGGRDALAPGIAVLASVVTVGVLVGATFGVLPALALTRAAARRGSLAGALGAQKGTARSHASPMLRRSLIVAQVAFTMMLLVGAGLMGRTIVSIATTPLGFNDEGVVKGDLFLPPARYEDPDALRGVVDKLLAAVSATPGVRQVAGAFPDPLRTFVLSPVAVTADGAAGSAETGPRAAESIVTTGYFELMAIPLKAGRAFTAQDDGHAVPVAIVSEHLARALWPGETAIGRRVRASNDSVWRTVVGVAGETRQPVEATETSELYVPYAQAPFGIISVLARVSRDAAGMGDALQRSVSRVDADLALASVAPLTDATARVTSRHRALATVLSLFAVLALGLAILGLYASLAYVVAQRRREIAIRMAIGADTWAVMSMVAREGLALVSVGVALGLALSVALTRLLASQLYGVTPTDPATFVAITAILGAAALVAALAPARQATRVTPAEVMRSD